MAWCLHQAALLHKFLHASVNFMIDWAAALIQNLLDSSEFEVATVLSLLVRRLIEFFIGIGIAF